MEKFNKFNVYDKEGRMKDPEIAREMAGAEEPYHENKFGVLKPSREDIAMGEKVAERVGAEIVDRKSREGFEKWISELQTNFDRIMRDGWIISTQIENERPRSLKNMFVLVKKTQEYSTGSSSSRHQVGEKMEMKFLSEDLRTKVNELLALDQKTRELVGFSKTREQGCGIQGNWHRTEWKEVFEIREIAETVK